MGLGGVGMLVRFFPFLPPSPPLIRGGPVNSRLDNITILFFISLLRTLILRYQLRSAQGINLAPYRVRKG